MYIMTENNTIKNNPLLHMRNHCFINHFILI